jgi:sulfur-oxidizing protein SoxA
MRHSTKITLVCTTLLTLGYSNSQFAMSDEDRAMYAEMLENNPADMMVNHGKELFDENCRGKEGLAKFLGTTTKNLPKTIATFPRYEKKIGAVVNIGQVLQATMSDNSHSPFKLDSSDMFEMDAYVKSIANGVPINVNANANPKMKATYALGKEVFETKRGGRGLSCLSCHSKEAIGTVLRTQPLPDLVAKNVNAAGTWPAYRMTKSELTTLQKRFQQCMDNALLAKIPLGSKEMNALEVYIASRSNGNKIAIPGIKR